MWHVRKKGQAESVEDAERIANDLSDHYVRRTSDSNEPDETPDTPEQPV